MSNRSDDWLTQARRDLAQAEASRIESRHEWACFAAHQAAEKAVKAVHLHHGSEVWGHIVTRLLQQLAVAPPDGLIEQARVLDNFYVPTRYPNGHAAGPPFEHYGPLQSEQAISYAHAIVEFAVAQMA